MYVMVITWESTLKAGYKGMLIEWSTTHSQYHSGTYTFNFHTVSPSDMNYQNQV